MFARGLQEVSATPVLELVSLPVAWTAEQSRECAGGRGEGSPAWRAVAVGPQGRSRDVPLGGAEVDRVSGGGRSGMAGCGPVRAQSPLRGTSPGVPRGGSALGCIGNPPHDGGQDITRVHASRGRPPGVSMGPRAPPMLGAQIPLLPHQSLSQMWPQVSGGGGGAPCKAGSPKPAPGGGKRLAPPRGGPGSRPSASALQRQGPRSRVVCGKGSRGSTGARGHSRSQLAPMLITRCCRGPWVRGALPSAAPVF